MREKKSVEEGRFFLDFGAEEPSRAASPLSSGRTAQSAPSPSIAAAAAVEEPIIKPLAFPVSSRAPAGARASALAVSDAPPVLKKLSFPEQVKVPVDAPVSSSSSPRTHFSSSISRSRPEFDSDDDLALPEDLPLVEEELPPQKEKAKRPLRPRALWQWVQRTQGSPLLQPETQSPEGLSPVSGPSPESDAGVPQQSPILGQRRSLAEEVRAAWRRTAKRKKAPLTAPEGAGFSERDSAAGGSRSEPARRASRPAPRWLAPVVTVGVAGLVYVASSQLLQAVPFISLQKSTAQIPHLGSLPAPAPAASGTQKKPDSVDAASSDSGEGETPRSASLPLVEAASLPEGMNYPGKGLIEVVTPERELIYVNGVFIGRGPLRRVPIEPGEHAVSIRSGGTEKNGTLVVEPERTTRASFVPPT